MTDMLGGQVAPSPHREFGFAAVTVAGGTTPRLFRELPADLRVWASHGDFVAAAPPGFCGRGDERQRAGGSDGGARIVATTRCCSTRKSLTPNAEKRSCATSRSTSADAPATGRLPRSSTSRSAGSVLRWATVAWCARCRAASTRPWPRPSSIARLAITCSASSWTTGFCASTRPTRSLSVTSGCGCRCILSTRRTNSWRGSTV